MKILEKTDKTFIKRLKKLLKDNNMTTQQLSEKVGISKSRIDSWLKGKTQPQSAMKVMPIARYFKVSMTYLIGL